MQQGTDILPRQFFFVIFYGDRKVREIIRAASIKNLKCQTMKITNFMKKKCFSDPLAGELLPVLGGNLN